MSAKQHHHHSPLLESITDLLDTRHKSGLNTNLHKIRAHTNIRGNALADAAAKLTVTHYDTLTPSHKRREEAGEIALRAQHWVMYTVKPPPRTPALSTGTKCATLCRPWWTIPEEDRMQMHAFTRPSPQLRTKVRETLLRSLHHSSLYRRLIVASKEKGPALRQGVKRFTRSSPIAHGRGQPF